jgi:hypothetical protein
VSPKALCSFTSNDCVRVLPDNSLQQLTWVVRYSDHRILT